MFMLRDGRLGEFFKCRAMAPSCSFLSVWQVWAVRLGAGVTRPL